MLIFSNQFLYRFLRTFESQEKKKLVQLDSRILGSFFRIIVWSIWNTVIGFGVGLVFFFFCLLYKRFRCVILESIFFSKIQQFCSFYEVYIRKPKLIWSLLVTGFPKSYIVPNGLTF